MQCLKSYNKRLFKTRIHSIIKSLIYNKRAFMKSETLQPFNVEIIPQLIRASNDLTNCSFTQ